jgi:hypothetical protein
VRASLKCSWRLSNPRNCLLNKNSSFLLSFHSFTFFLLVLNSLTVHSSSTLLHKILGKMEGGEMGGGGCPSWCRGGWLSLMRSVPVVGGDGRYG